MQMRYIRGFKNFKLLLENKTQALNLLRKNKISNKNADFLEITKLLEDKFNNLNLLGQLTKYRFIQKVSQDEIKDLIRWLDESKGSKLLSKPIMQYKFFEELKDEIIQIDMNRKIKLVLNGLPKYQKDLYNNATEKEKDLFDGWSVKMFDIKYKEPFFKKISKIKTIDELIDYIESFVEKNLNLKSYDDKILEIESIDSAQIFKIDDEVGIISVRIDSYQASKKLGSSSWCISTSLGSWSSYVYNKQAYQYFIWNYSLSPADPLFLIGVTVGVNDKILNIHDMNDRSLLNNIPQFIKDLKLKGMKSEEYLKRIETIRKEKREESKNVYETDPKKLLLAEALQEYLESEGLWLDEYDIYDIIPDSYDYYGLSEFSVDLPEGEMQFAIGDDKECDMAAKECLESLYDDIGPEGFSQNVMEDFIDSKSLAEDLLQDERDYFREIIEEDPDYYDVKRMSEEQSDRLDELKEREEILLSKSDISNYEDELTKIQDEITELEDKDNWEINEDLLEEKIEELYKDAYNEIINDPLDYVISRGLTRKYLEDYIDKESLFDHIIDIDGRGNSISSYDGNEGEVYFNDKWYYVYRTG